MQSQTEWQLPNPSTWEVAAATTKSPLFSPKVIGSSDLYSEFQDSAVRPFLKEKPNSKLFNGNLGYRVRSCLNNKPKNKPNQTKQTKKPRKGWRCVVLTQHVWGLRFSPQNCMNWAWWATCVTSALEAGGLEVWGHPCLQRELEASLLFMRSYLKKWKEGSKGPEKPHISKTSNVDSTPCNLISWKTEAEGLP